MEEILFLLLSPQCWKWQQSDPAILQPPHQHFSDFCEIFFVFHCVHNMQEAVILHSVTCHVLGCVYLLVVCTEVIFSVCLQSIVSQVHAGLKPKPYFLGNKTWKPLLRLYTGWPSQTGRPGQETVLVAGAAQQSRCSFIVSEIILPSDDPALLWQQLCLPRAFTELCCSWEGDEEQEKHGIRSGSRFWQ